LPQSRLQQELHQSKPFANAQVEAYLNLLRTHDRLHGDVLRFLKGHGISAPQYNVLRILRGAGDDGLPCLQIAERVVTRVPDITRLLDRLEAAGFVRRTRSEHDGRVVLSRITESGLELLADLDQPLLAFHDAMLGHMTTEELSQLSHLLEKARAAE
jgi:DNA-binding MarR family transcriptional regulator